MIKVINENSFPTVTKKITVKTAVNKLDENSDIIAHAELSVFIDKFIENNDVILVSRDKYVTRDYFDIKSCYSMSFEYKTYDTSKAIDIKSYSAEGDLQELSHVLNKFYNYCDIIDYKLEVLPFYEFSTKHTLMESPKDYKYYLVVLYKNRVHQEKDISENEKEIWI